MTLMIQGDGVSRGIAIGEVRILHEIQPKVRARKISNSRRRAELKRFRTAVSRAKQELEQAKSQLPETGTGPVLSILDSHIGMLQDTSLIDPIEDWIVEHNYSTEWALATHRDELLKLFENIDDPYIRERSVDVEETITRLLKHLDTDASLSKGEQKKQKEFVLVASGLAPSDLIHQQQTGLIAAITEEGSPLSHTTIIAKNLGIPLIVNARHAISLLDEDDQVIIDGSHGTVLANADRRAVRNFRAIERREKHLRRCLTELAGKATESKDRQRIYVRANIGSLKELTLAKKSGAEGIGLFRTESLYLNRDDLPDEDEQFRIYKKMIARMNGEPLIIRTMDIWTSSRTPGLEQHVPRSEQPALGMRAIRLCLRYPELFIPQLRALMRAAHHGPISMLVPMISVSQELRDLQQLVAMVQAQLKRQRRAHQEQLRIGAMIEVPAAAIAARSIAPLVDFFAIGSNDLAQYTLAMDRDDSHIQPMLDPINPAVLHLIREVVKAGSQHQIPVSLCGEMAGDPKYTRLLLGLGLRDLSMHPSSILDVKSQIVNADIGRIENLSRSMLRSSSAARTRTLLEKINSL